VELTSVLRGIGRNLVTLELEEFKTEVIDVLVENCPNLHHLDVWVFADVDLGEEAFELIERKLASGMKRLAILKVNGVYARLGTDWEGY
jgi:hypothetical protein